MTNPDRRWSVTTRLMLWWTVVFGTLAVTVFASIYIHLSSGLLRRFDEELLREARELCEVSSGSTVEAFREEIDREISVEGRGRMYIRLLSPGLEVLAASDAEQWQGLGIDESAMEALRSQDAVFTSAILPERDETARVVHVRTELGDILMVALTMTDEQRLLVFTEWLMGIALTSMLVLGLLAGWLLVRRAMAGVDTITLAALRIHDGELTFRVPESLGGREVDDLARTLNEMLDRIKSLVDQLRQVTNDVAHDMRGPLTRIRGCAELALTEKGSTAETRALAGTVVGECDRLIGMIRAAMELAEAEAGVLRSQAPAVDLVATVADAVDLFGPAAEDAGLTLTSKLPAGPVVVSCNLSHLQRMVANLLDNAIKYTAAGGSVEVVVLDAGGRATMTVTDTGCGISPDDMVHVFERFFRCDTSRTTPGNGLGLPLARALARAYGGDVTAVSVPDLSSTFTLVLPRSERP